MGSEFVRVALISVGEADGTNVDEFRAILIV